MLKSQDILVLLKMMAKGSTHWSYNELAYELGMSPSQAHSAVKRALLANLAVKRGGGVVPHLRNLEEFLIHGLKYVFPPERGELTRGLPTSYAAAPLNELIVTPSTEPPPVWPDPEGIVKGMAFEPLCKYVPNAARSDEELYKLLVLIDAIRSGHARERKIAVEELGKQMGRECGEY